MLAANLRNSLEASFDRSAAQHPQLSLRTCGCLGMGKSVTSFGSSLGLKVASCPMERNVERC